MVILFVGEIRDVQELKIEILQPLDAILSHFLPPDAASGGACRRCHGALVARVNKVSFPMVECTPIWNCSVTISLVSKAVCAASATQ